MDMDFREKVKKVRIEIIVGKMENQNLDKWH